MKSKNKSTIIMNNIAPKNKEDINKIDEKIKIGDIVKGQVTGVTKYGVFMSFEDEYSGLVHISEVSNKYVKDLKERFMVGDVIRAKVIDIDSNKNHLKLIPYTSL